MRTRPVGGCPLVDADNRWDEPLHPERSTTEPVVRVVLAEAAAAPGPLHYLLEGEGFQVLGCASDDSELTRLLTQSTQPEVIVVDAAVPATTVMVAHEFAPGSELIVIWPDGVVAPASADQVLPELVFEDLGPAVRRAAKRNRLRRPVVEDTDDVVEVARNELERVDLPNVAARQTAARVLVGTVAVIASILVTMGVSFALEGWRAAHLPTPARSPSLATPTAALPGRSSPPASVRETPGSSSTTDGGCVAGRRSGPNEHAANHAKERAGACPTQAGGGSNTAHGSGHGSGRGSGQGSATGSGQGSGQGAGQGSGQGTGAAGSHGQGSGAAGSHGQGSGAAGSHGPEVDPPTPSLPPSSGDHPGPKD
jgi:hypothetical protein